MQMIEFGKPAFTQCYKIYTQTYTLMSFNFWTQISILQILHSVGQSADCTISLSHAYVLVPFTHMRYVSSQFEKVSWTTQDFKVKMQSITVLCGNFWSWVGVHFITKPCEHNNRNLYLEREIFVFLNVCFTSPPWFWDRSRRIIIFLLVFCFGFPP